MGMTWQEAIAVAGLCPDDVRMWRVILFHEAHKSQRRPKVVHSAGLPPALYSPGKGFDRHRLYRSRREEVVNGETRGEDWGKGRAAAEFERLRRERAKIKKGRAVEYDVLSNLGLPVKHLIRGGAP